MTNYNFSIENDAWFEFWKFYASLNFVGIIDL